MRTQAVGYVRVSTREQAQEGVSLAAQERALRCYARAKGWQLVAVERDEGASGKSMDRPGLQAALAALDAGQASILLVCKLDRLSRRVRDLLGLVEERFADGRQHLVSLGENVDTTSPVGRAMLGMIAVFAQLERESIVERVRNGLAEARRQGTYLGRVPIAHRRERGRLVADRQEANRIRRAQRMREHGASWAQVARAFDWTVSQARTRLDARQRARGRGKEAAG